MKKALINSALAVTLAASSGLLLAGPAAAGSGSCVEVPILDLVQYPATPAVTEVRLVPAVTGEERVPAVYFTEYEYIQRASQEGEPGVGAGTRWESEGWNADGNPASNGWVRTGAERQQVLVPEHTRTVVLVPAHEELVVLVPAAPAYEVEEQVGVRLVCEPWGPPAPLPEAPAGPAEPLPLPEAPVAPVPAVEAPAPAPVAPVGAVPAVVPAVAPAAHVPAPVAAVPAPAALPAELAYTGAREDTLAAAAVLGGLLLMGGTAAVVFARRRPQERLRGRRAARA